MKQLIAQGAESRLFLKDNEIIKDRFNKKYRIKEIDERLRKSRTKREAKILEKLSQLEFPAPKLIKTNKKDEIIMSEIKGKLVKVIFDKNYQKLSKEIGEKLAILHNNTIIHGDLTTSNMIFNKEIHFIDFGLSFFSYKEEDKAVDLHLLKQALESKHFKVWEKAFKEVIKGYKEKAEKGKEIINRLEKVEKRGRYKQKK